MPKHDAELVLPMGILHGGSDHRERWRGRACEEPHLRRVRLLHDELHLPDRRCMVLGRWLVGLRAGCGLLVCMALPALGPCVLLICLTSALKMLDPTWIVDV